VLSIKWGITTSLYLLGESCRAMTAARKNATLRRQSVVSKLSLTGYGKWKKRRAPLRASHVVPIHRLAGVPCEPERLAGETAAADLVSGAARLDRLP
jgi:hypothetical protein